MPNRICLSCANKDELDIIQCVLPDLRGTVAEDLNDTNDPKEDIRANLQCLIGYLSRRGHYLREAQEKARMRGVAFKTRNV